MNEHEMKAFSFEADFVLSFWTRQNLG